MKLEGKGVFLTGGAMGIGRAVMELLLQSGARVLFCDVSEEVGSTTRQELWSTYPESDVIFVQCDVSNATQLTEAFQRAVMEFGAVEVCINNAAIMDERVWEKMIDINQVGVIRGSYLALEHMRRDKGGRGGVIINTASVLGLHYGQWTWAVPVYSSSKRAIIAFTTSWASNPDQGQQGVRWGVVCPDGTVTAINSALGDRVIRHTRDQDGPDSERLAGALQPTDVAHAFMTLLDDDDSNGDVIKVHRDTKVVNSPIIQTVLEVDNTDPVDSLKVKKVISKPPCDV
ncbi:15-hydroxyprostaglandin dehydrogenase [NAD(+)]-like [Littorina saxatilis]|uniref:15-hydroxyprostaglandin dehydrogenase [NAD(+)] n=1 Tax=Littorina saxatilis TaxID=31220 RepID=A0AAN9ALY1_9CAEN